MDSHFELLSEDFSVDGYLFYLIFLPRVIEFSLSFGFPKKQAGFQLFLDARYFSCCIKTHEHQCKEFQLYFYCLSIINRNTIDFGREIG